jgi:hypothetical protein
MDRRVSKRSIGELTATVTATTATSPDYRRTLATLDVLVMLEYLVVRYT